MLNKIFRNPIAIEIGDQTVKFSSLADFEFALTGRDAIPAEKVCATIVSTSDKLKDESEANQELEDRLSVILRTSGNNPAGIHAALKDVESAAFTRDHKWRDIIKGLKESDEDVGEFCRLALAKYIQYLKTRQEVIRTFSKK